MVEHFDRLTRQDFFREQEQRHVGAAPGSVHREETQARGRQCVEMAVRVRHQLVCFLARRVQAHRMIDRVAHRKRQLAVGAVDRTRRGIDQVLDLAVPATLQDVDEPGEIALHVRARVLERVTHTGLRGQIDDALRRESCECRVDRLAILQRCLDEAELCMRRQTRQARFLESHVVIIVEIVDSEHFVAAREQAFAQCRADETCRAGDQNPHHRSFGYKRSSTSDFGSTRLTSNSTPPGLASARIFAAPISTNCWCATARTTASYFPSASCAIRSRPYSWRAAPASTHGSYTSTWVS